MAKRISEIAVNSPYLNGLAELSEYLHMDKRVVKRELLDAGLRPRSNVGASLLYHKADVDKFLIIHNKLNNI